MPRELSWTLQDSLIQMDTQQNKLFIPENTAQKAATHLGPGRSLGSGHLGETVLRVWLLD